MNDLLSVISVLVLILIFKDSYGGGVFSAFNSADKDEESRDIDQEDC